MERAVESPPPYPALPVLSAPFSPFPRAFLAFGHPSLISAKKPLRSRFWASCDMQTRFAPYPAALPCRFWPVFRLSRSGSRIFGAMPRFSKKPPLKRILGPRPKMAWLLAGCHEAQAVVPPAALPCPQVCSQQPACTYMLAENMHCMSWQHSRHIYHVCHGKKHMLTQYT